MKGIMFDVSKAMERVAAGPWRAGLMVLGASFLTASLVSAGLGYLVTPSLDKRTSGGRSMSPSNIRLPEPTPTLTQPAIDTIVNRNIFSSEGKAQLGVASKTVTKGDGDKAVEIVKSDLPIALTGTIYGGDPLSGIALIENTTKKTVNSFMVGDTILKDVTLKEIHKQKIIIDNNGRLEFVEVVQERLVRSRRAKKAPSSATAGTDNVAPIATEPPPPSFKEEGFERKEREITMSQSYRSKLLTTDFTKVLQDAKASPNMVDGELKGFVMTRIRKDSIYEKAGLQNDDIVTEVNGVPLTDTAQSIRLLQSLRGESEIEVRIIRAGTPLKFNLNVK